MRDGRKQSDIDGNIFRAAMEGVRPIQGTNLAAAGTARRKEPAIAASRPDGGTVVPEERGFRRPGIQKAVFRNLRNGRIPIEDELDLHGRTRTEARRDLDRFLRESQVPGRRRAIRVIHGKGLRSPEGTATLRESVAEWLAEFDAVLASCEAGPGDGGSGAGRVLLKADRAR